MARTWKTRTTAWALWTVAATAGCSSPTLAPTDSTAPPMDPTLAEINEDYVESVKPLFARSCVSCHGAGNALPWYHALPLVRGMIDDDIAKARRNVDMSHDFPFRGRGTPADYLDAIHDVVVEGSMPPLRYRVMHWGALLDGEDKDRVLLWVERSQQRMRQKAPPAR
jgi:mono/diheme cytochrome c family protein